MATPFQRVRSVLSVPAHDEHKVAGARSHNADLIMWDLEDSVPHDRKAEARDLIAKFARPGDCIRVSAVASSEFDADIALAQRLGALILVPKVETRDLPLVTGFVLSIESPSAVLAAAEIARCSSGIAFGRYDFMACCGISSIWSPLVDHAMAQVALAAFAAGIPVSDAPCYSTTPDGLLEREIKRARRYGFTSKCCIHPSQIAACSAFGPSASERAAAERTVTNWSADTPISVNGGRMSGPPDLRRAQNILTWGSAS